ncbi:C40 family peptidase [Pseudomonas sp. GD04087]|uniref:C40 family peptidase n=1 Tax=unclassified Pseudomonas TaxID=196821 RepID=UPI0024469106|nr:MULTISPECIES: C40 family peptidase [unclassified Pseudomonas]MDH0289457.1 C40 family peptidase [Pseudomonas sp. GD04087]MDH1052248.1 C40 family peptidase [Pseudomonas sp. GD03903]MDH1999011.1 C40 family peptidase [Pseudomonas sp. GD03691]
MRSLTLLSTTLLLTLSLPFAEARESKNPTPHKATTSLSRAAHAKSVNHNTVRLQHGTARPRLAGQRLGRLTANSRVVARARELIGVPYRYGGTSVSSGFDCSGLLVYLFRTEAGMTVPRTTGEMIESGGTQVDRQQLRPGDAVFFNQNGRGNVSHVGLYIGNNQFIHAPSSGETIRMDSLANNYWQRSFTTARRFNG